MVTDEHFWPEKKEFFRSQGSTFVIRIVFVRHRIMQIEFIPPWFGLLYKQCKTLDVLISFLYIAAKTKWIEMVLPKVK